MNLSDYLEPTFFMDFEEPNLVDLAEGQCHSINNATDRAVALYYAVRDRIFYYPYDLNYTRADFQASAVLRKGRGYCVAKALLLAALARQQRIPSRLGFADVTNHIASPKLLEKMGTDLFIFHGYTELYLQGRWVKATPAFNLSLCEHFDVKPLEFNGVDDSIFHEFDSLGRRHLEYVRDHGFFSDLPYDLLFTAYRQTYPNFF
jgi:transglutaminase-like putative cysteine protease